MTDEIRMVEVKIPAHGCFERLGHEDIGPLLEMSMAADAEFVSAAMEAGLCPRCTMALRFITTIAVVKGISGISTGNIYRAIALAFAATGVDPNDADFGAAMRQPGEKVH